MQTMPNTSLSVAGVPHPAPQWGAGGEADRLAPVRGEVATPSIRPIHPSAESIERSAELLSHQQQRLLDQLYAQVLQGPLPRSDGLERDPSSGNVRLAEHVIHILPINAHPSRVGIADDGEIIFEWGTPGEGVEVAIADDGQIAAVLPLPGGDCEVMDIAPSDAVTSLPHAVLRAIQAVG